MISASISLQAETTELKAPPFSNVTDQQFSHWLEVKKNKQNTLDELISSAGGEAHASPYLNSLILENSPYLLRHASNPINWQPWQASVFTEAEAQGRLVFLSIGYSTCHWCHVMEKQSFINEDIADLLNRNYISVKVDREQLPDIDAYYSNALEAVVGSSGWPVTVILDTQGKILFINSYLEQPVLMKLLGRFASLWQKNPNALKNNASLIAQLIKSQSAPEVSGQWNDALLDETEKTLLGLLDKQFGGFSGVQKFPAENSLFFMLNRIEKASLNNQELKLALELQLKAMAKGGLYDHVHGGFHRYSTDSLWQVPHYEKMLYNQSQLMIIYSRAYRLFGDPFYHSAVQDIAVFLRSWMYEKDAGFYSAIDADYKGHEGLYYLWSEEELKKLFPKAKDSLKTYAFEQGDLLGVLLNAPELQATIKIRKKLRQARSNLPRPHIDKKIITAWNAQMVWALAEAYAATGDDSFKQWAQQSAELLWSKHFDKQSDRLIRSRYLTERADNGQLDDYAYFALAAIKIYDLTSDKLWLKRAEHLTKIAVDLFMDTDGGFYLSEKSAISDEAKPHHVKMKSQREGELVPAGAVLTGVLRDLHKRTGQRQYRVLMQQAELYLKNKFVSAGIDHLYAGAILSDSISGSVASLQYFANGKGRISMESYAASCGKKNNLRINIRLDSGWHVNSAQPLQAFLKPTRIDVEGSAELTAINYPEGKLETLGFQQQALSLYDGDFSIDLVVKQNASLEQSMLVAKLQACSESVCLLPETLRLSISPCRSINHPYR